MTKVGKVRLLVVILFVVLLEVLCRTGAIDPFSMVPPSEAAWALGRMMATSSKTGAILKTFGNIATALVTATVVGIVIAIVLHRFRELRRTLDPLFAAYYSIPIFVFYPLFIVLFGLGDFSQILIGFLFAVVTMIVATLDGLDRVNPVLLRTARIYRMGPFGTAWRITLPSMLPYVFTGLKLASAYAFTGVIGSEFILSSAGVGFEISNAYASFNNDTMYALILLIVLLAAAFSLGFDRLESSFGRHKD